MRNVLLAGTLVLALLGVACGGLHATPTPAPKDRVSVATLGVSSEAAIYIGIDRGYFAEQGIDVQLVPFKNATDIIPAVATNQVDVGTGAPSAALFNALAAGIPLKVVASNSRLEPGRDGGAIVLRKDLASVIRTAADLKGRSIGCNCAAGGIAEFVLDRLLGTAGLSVADVNVVAVPGGAELLTALGTGRADSAIMAEPWVSLGRQQGTLVVWKPFAELAPSMEWNELVYSATFATQRADVARRFMLARLEAVRDYDAGFFAGGDRAALVSILTRYTPVTDPRAYEQMSFSEMDPDGRVDARALEQLQDWYTAHGSVARRADIRAALDASFASYAVGVLGPAQGAASPGTGPAGTSAAGSVGAEQAGAVQPAGG